MTNTEGTATTQDAGWTANDASFGARLALIRQRMGWGNIAKAAKECGVPTDSWRNWEVDGREPHRLTTIAMAIATKTGCDYLWLVHGPDRGSSVRRKTYVGARVIGQIAAHPTSQANGSPDLAERRTHTGRPVRQTRPLVRVASRPATPIAV